MTYGFENGTCDQCHKDTLCAQVGPEELMCAVLEFCEDCYPEFFVEEKEEEIDEEMPFIVSPN